MKTQVIMGVVVLCLLIGAPAVYAEQFGHQYYWGWRDGYYMWAFSAQTHDNYGWPNDDEGHPPNYWKGADAGMQYAKEHVMMKVIHGHVLTELNATTHITDWFDGQNAHIQGRPLLKMYASNAYIAGYNATYGTLPPEIPLVERELAQKLTYP